MLRVWKMGLRPIFQVNKETNADTFWLRNLKGGSSIQRVPIRPSNDKLQSLDVVRAKSIQNRVITLVQKQILLSSDKIDENMLQAFMYWKKVIQVS